MESLDIVVETESFESALRYLEAYEDFTYSEVQRGLVRLLKGSPLSNKMLLGHHGVWMVANENESETQASFGCSATTLRHAVAVVFVLICVSQPNRDCAVIMPNRAMAEEFIDVVRKLLDLFKDSEEFGWTLIVEDIRKLICIKTKKHNATNRIRACVKDTSRGLSSNCFIVELAS